MENLKYTHHEGISRTIEGLKITTDKTGRMWLWSEYLECYLAYKYKNKEDLLLASIDSLLFIISLRDERIKALQHVKDQVDAFIGSVRPDDNDD